MFDSATIEQVALENSFELDPEQDVRPDKPPVLFSSLINVVRAYSEVKKARQEIATLEFIKPLRLSHLSVSDYLDKYGPTSLDARRLWERLFSVMEDCFMLHWAEEIEKAKEARKRGDSNG